ncbi:MAG: zincin-like metallopeptidase toxin domain-containing protein [Pseudomonadota bacterium]
MSTVPHDTGPDRTGSGLGQTLASQLLNAVNIPPYAKQAASLALQTLQNGAAPDARSLMSMGVSAALPGGVAGQVVGLAASAVAAQVSTARHQARGREYEIVGEADPAVCPCEYVGVGVPFVPEDEELDRLVSVDVEALPTSDMVLPAISPNAPMTEQGMLDALARSYPQEAWQLLYILGPSGGGGGLGYRLVFHDSQADYDRIGGEMQAVRDRYASPSAPGGNARIQSRNRNRELGALRTAREDGLNDWRFDDATKELHVYTWAEGDIFGDLWQDRELTNQDAADRLRDLIGQHFNGEETFWQTTGRVAMGTGLVVFGAVDIFAGVTLATGGTAATGGLGAAVTIGGGLALTAIGADQVAQGTRMLISPDPQDHYGPIGAIINEVGRMSGGESGARIADRAYMVTQVLVSLGGAIQMARLARVPATGVRGANIVGEALENAPRQMELRGLVIRDYPVNHFGQTARITPTLTGRGLEVNMQGSRFLLREGNHLREVMRVLLRSRTLDDMASRIGAATRRLLKLGAPRMTAAQARAISREAGEYGASVRRLSNSQFDAQFGARTNAAFNNQTNTLLLREDATYYEAFHELQHARHMHEIGPDAYRALGNGDSRMQRYLRERYVYDRLMENADNIGMSAAQRGHATDYVNRVARRAGAGSDLRLPSNVSISDIERYRSAVNSPPLSRQERQLLQRLWD